MKQFILCFLLASATLASAQVTAPAVNLQPGAVITLPTGAVPSATAVADYNQDNRPDIAVCQRGLGTVRVYVQSAAGNFPAGPVSTYSVEPGPTGLVAVVLGLAALPKTVWAIIDPTFGAPQTLSWYFVSNQGVTNTPSTHLHK